MMKLEIRKESRKKAFDRGWLLLQRSSISAIAENDYESASRYLTLAYFMTRNMSPQDPRTLLTWELVAEFRELEQDFKSALFWRHKLADRKHRLFGPSPLLLLEMRHLVRLYTMVGNWQKAVQFSEWTSSLASVAPEVLITEGAGRSRLNSSAIQLVSLVRGSDRKAHSLTQVC